jgi:ABC-type transporter Mla MlaB component
MLRITQSPAVQITTINLEGKLLVPWIDEVRAAVDAARGCGRVCVNLAKLQFADHAGIALLRGLRDDGIELLQSSPLIEGLLSAGQSA